MTKESKMTKMLEGNLGYQGTHELEKPTEREAERNPNHL